MSVESCTVGIDIGTTSVKTVAFTRTGQEIARSAEQLSVNHTEDGGAEQDAREVYAAVLSSLADLMPKVTAKGFSARQVGFSAAMHSLLAVDASGVPLTGAMTWMDVRSKHAAAQLWASGDGKAVYAKTGTPVHPMSPLPKLIWLRRERPDLFHQAVKFVSLKEYVWYQWFGEWVIDASMASATGLYNLRTRQWSTEAMGLAGVEAGQLSRIVPTTYTRTGVTEASMVELGFSADTAFNIGASDGVLANLGAGAIHSDAMVITIGTSCALRLGSTKPITDTDTRSFCYVLADDRFIVGGPSNSGGIVVDWLYRNIVGSDGEARMEGLSQLLSEAGHAHADELICLPYVTGERAPLWNADAKAAFIGLQVHHTRAHLMRAALEGILLNAYWIASRLFTEVGKPKRLVTSGKLLELPWVRQMAADIFGIAVQYGEAVDASTVGAALLAEIGSGVRTWDEIPQWAVDTAMLLPDAQAHADYQAKFARFQALVRALNLNTVQ